MQAASGHVGKGVHVCYGDHTHGPAKVLISKGGVGRGRFLGLEGAGEGSEALGGSFGLGVGGRGL